MVPWNQVNLFVISITKLVYDVTIIQSSDVISSSRLQNIICAPRTSRDRSSTRITGPLVDRGCCVRRTRRPTFIDFKQCTKKT